MIVTLFGEVPTTPGTVVGAAGLGTADETGLALKLISTSRNSKSLIS